MKARFGENPPPTVGLGHTRVYRDVIDAIQNDRAPAISAEDGRAAIELILAIYRSAATGKPVELPLKDGATVDYQGRFA